MENILATLLKDSYTLNQLKHKLAFLRSYLEQQFFKGEESKDLFAETDLTWLKSLPQKFLQSFNKDNLYSTIEDLQNQIIKLPTLILYLTFDPNTQTISEIGEYVRKTFQTKLILDLKYDPNLIAGASLVWKGLYRDYSLRSRIDERQLAILQSFKQFLR